MSDTSGSSGIRREDAEFEDRRPAIRMAEAPAPSEQGGGVLGLFGRASTSALNFGREVGGSAQRLTRHIVDEAEHLVDVALTEPEPHVVVHGEVLEAPALADPPEETTPTREELRRRGDRLLARSTEAPETDGPHPAYAHILTQLSPDEARILRLLARDGAQPSIDVRTSRPFGVGSESVAAGLSMISEIAGCRHHDRIAAYLGNLYRLGLIWFSKEQVEVQRYELLQVQPKVVDAVSSAGRNAKTIRRRIEITPFGRDLCTTCFTLG